MPSLTIWNYRCRLGITTLVTSILIVKSIKILITSPFKTYIYIISQIPSPTYNMAKFFNSILEPFLPAKHYIQSTDELLDLLKITKPCGTCHMVSFFSPLSRTTTAAICSSSNLLLATFTQHLASHPTSAPLPLLTTSSPLPSPLIVTSHPDQKGLMPLLAVLLVSIRDALLTTYTWLPSHLSVDSHHEYL